MTKSSTVRRIIDQAEWDGANEYSTEIKYSFREPDPYPYYRFINGLDVSVDITVEFTDSFDESEARLESSEFFIDSNVIGWPVVGGNPGGQTSQSSVTINSGNHNSFALAPTWDRVFINITPAAEPTAGEFQIINMK